MDQGETKIRIPVADALALGPRSAVLVTPDGEVVELDGAVGAARIEKAPVYLVHGRAVARRFGRDHLRALDLLELFAFIRPARFCLPTPGGLAEALGRPRPHGVEAEAAILPDLAATLLAELAHEGDKGDSDAAAIAWSMGRAGWPWAPFVLAALGRPSGAEGASAAARGLEVWRGLPEWQGDAPPPPPGTRPVPPAEARRRLAEMLGEGSEPRPSQADFASAATAAFEPREAAGQPRMVLAEAGTGVGKTLGYLAPATVWAEINAGPVWVSTYTRNLQHQIDQELARLWPEDQDRRRFVTIRKGRENYLCLLNFEEALRGAPARLQDMVGLGLMARWTAATRDGDMTGGDFPGWLPDLVGRGRTLGLADRRGECVFSACQHYQRCFIEHGQRRARRAKIVIANHALAMILAAQGGGEDGTLPPRYVFDEGHHLFDAADGTFAAHLSGLETSELRRWLLGPETGGRASRARGLKRRAEDLLGEDPAGPEALDRIERAARELPQEGWLARLRESRPMGAAEHFLERVYVQVRARAPGADGPYGLECEPDSPVDGAVEAAGALKEALRELDRPLGRLHRVLTERLDREAGELDSQTRVRIEAIARSIERRRLQGLGAWIAMLDGFGGATPEGFVDWFAIERDGGRELDVGWFRHWIDPTIPFARSMAGHAHGILVTSATLTDGSGDPQADWAVAEARTGAVHMPAPAIRARVPSPFDYPRQTRVYIVRDVRKDDLDQVAAAYRELFLAAGGGGLGLFTAVSRLKEVHRRIAGPLETAGVPLWAQHVDGMDVATLVDIFRGEEDACLLGTDAVRDGVDVPGRSLRLIVFDRVPWPRPDIVFKARREAFGGGAYTDAMTRAKLRQAFGRLVRRADDHGVFVLLDPMTPTRLLGAFPEGVEVSRCGLAEAVESTRSFLNPR